MTLSDLASLGSFVSGVAVLFSFMFLALQLRQANANQQALMQTTRNGRGVDAMFHSVEPHVVVSMIRGRAADPTMSPEEVEVFLQTAMGSLLGFEDTYLQFRAGTIHADAWEVARSRLATIFASPGWRVVWKKRKAGFNSGFTQEVDRIVAQARTSGFVDRTANWAADVAEEKALATA